MVPPDAPSALGRALELHQAGQRDAALALYDEAIRAQPGLAFSHYARGILLNELGRAHEALDSLAEACRLAPTQAGWQADRGAIAFALNQREVAIDAFRRAVAADASRADVWGQLGDLLADRGEWQAALVAYQSATRAQPAFASAWINLSHAAQQLGNGELALEAARRACGLLPGDSVAKAALANAMRVAGQAAQAVSLLQPLVMQAPANAALRLDFARALLGVGRRDEARAELETGLALDPDSVPVRLELADILRLDGRVEDAAALFRAVLTYDPANASAAWSLGNLAWQAGHHLDAAKHYCDALRSRPYDAALHSNLLYAQLYDFSLAPAELLAKHREYSRRHELPLKTSWTAHSNLRDAGRRIRIGYVSADFRSHPVAHFLLPLLVHHDHAKFQVTAYASQRTEDDFTRRLSAAVDHWVPCADMGDDELAARIRADGIDLLIDLSGHTAGNRLPVFARKPAPVQLTWLSYPGTTGLDAIDYRITDGIADPPGADSSYSERLIRLPDSLCCFEPAPYMPDPGPLPAITRGAVTFASFNNYNKLTDDCLALWARLLRAVPDSRLLLAAMPAGGANAEALARLGRLGVDAARVTLLGKLPGPAFVRAMQQADIALDPFPLTGGTTTMECLWMGLPTLVLQGDRFISRVGASFLTTAGLNECLASSPDDYLERGRRMATDTVALSALRAGLRRRLSASALLDAPRFTRGFEAALREAWRRWCAGLSPAPISGSDVR